MEIIIQIKATHTVLTSKNTGEIISPFSFQSPSKKTDDTVRV